MQDFYGKPLWVLGHHIRILDTSGGYSMLEVVTKPGVPGPPPHHHDEASEFFYVADGVLEVLADGTWHRLEKGGSFSIPPGVVHTFRNPDEVPTTWVTGFCPPDFVHFFATFGVPAEQPGAEAASTAPEVFARLAQEAKALGMIIQAPPAGE